MPKPEKIEAVAEIRRLFESAGSFFVTDYQGLNVADMTVLRRNLRENSIKYLIAKNSMLRIAAKEAGIDGLDEHLIGPTAVAFADRDPAVAAKVLHDSFKARELPRMKVFRVDNRLFEASEIKRLADLPPRDVLLARLAAAVEAPFSSLMGSLHGFFRELVGLIDTLADKKGREG